MSQAGSCFAYTDGFIYPPDAMFNDPATPVFIDPIINPPDDFAYTKCVSSAYHADAVHFDGSTWLDTASATAPDSRYVSISFWFRIVSPYSTNWTFFVTDPNNAYDNDGFINSGNRLSFTFFDGSGTNLPHLNLLSTDVIVSAVWHNALLCVDTQGGVGALYLDDVLQDAPTVEGAPFTMLYSTLEFVVGGDTFDGDGLVGDMADFWWAPGTNLLTGSAIAEADRRKFISADGKPVNPSGFPASAVLFSGNAAAFGTNQGTGGTFTTTGTLTNASTSPSD